MLIQRKLILVFCSFISSISLLYAGDKETFAPSEHVTMGDNVILRFTDNIPGTKGAPLTLPNGLSLTYGDIISLGDYYEIVGEPISLGNSPAERDSRFIHAVDSFAIQDNKTELQEILTVIHNEKKIIEDVIKRGGNPEATYHELSGDNDRQYNCITGGGCEPKTWWLHPGRYLQLAMENYDHFGDNAWLAYNTGHQVALTLALSAGKNKDQEKLAFAYAVNAFACHFLTDRFSAGHMRTPRNYMASEITPSIVGSLLANFMHAEDNTAGIHVHNSRGDHWIAFGDGAYFNKTNKDNLKILHEALQISADEIFTAYQTGKISTTGSIIYPLIPFADENGSDFNQDIASLFYWDNANKKLMRREDVTNLYDYHWTSDWWGWSTLVMLNQQRGLPEKFKAQLISAGFTKEAVSLGIISEKEVSSLQK